MDYSLIMYYFWFINYNKYATIILLIIKQANEGGVGYGILCTIYSIIL